MKFHVIVAICKKNYGIGKDNAIPWNLGTDLSYFKRITTESNNGKNVVIMGRNTWESIPYKYKPLSDRVNIVLTSNDLEYDGVHFCKSLDDSIELINMMDGVNKDNIFIIGGERLYREAINHENCSKVYVTEIYNHFECDKFFPKLGDNYKLITVSKFQEENGVHFRFLQYQNDYFIYEDIYGKSIIWRNEEEYQYLDTLGNILTNGLDRDDRTGVGTKSVFGMQYKYDISDTFPLLTTKRVFIRAVFEELMLYLRGHTDNGKLQEKGIHIWDGNTTREFLDKRGLSHYKENDMGETYGFNFRHYGGEYNGYDKDYQNVGCDQLEYILDLIRTDPTSRRIIINLWNPHTLHKATLPSCLSQYQFYVDTKNKKLNLQIYLRSSDFFLANNWNTCTGALFMHLICNLVDIDLTPGILTVVTGDTHLYNNHLDQVKENLERIPRPFPKLIIKKELDNIENFSWEDIKLIDYNPYPNIKVLMAV